MTLSFLWAACASSAPPSATAADFARVAQAERDLDVAHTQATREDTPCEGRAQAATEATAAADRVCTTAQEHDDADLVQRCEAARRLALHTTEASDACAEEEVSR